MKAGPLVFDPCVPTLPSREFGGINPALSIASQTSLPGLVSSASAFRLLSRWAFSTLTGRLEFVCTRRGRSGLPLFKLSLLTRLIGSLSRFRLCWAIRLGGAAAGLQSAAIGTATAVDRGDDECSRNRSFHFCRASLSLPEGVVRLELEGCRDVGGTGGGVGDASFGRTQLLS